MTAPAPSVRPAGPGDVPALAAVQVRALRAGYADLLPPGALDGLTEDAAAAAWRAAVEQPPSPAYRVLVAVDADGVHGFAAVGPSGDPDASGADAELLALHVDPAARARGHGSRLLAAAVDGWRAGGAAGARTWVLEGDDPLRRWLTGAGWAPDGAVRALDAGGAVTQLRYATTL